MSYQGPQIIHIVGVKPEDTVGLALKEAFDDHVLFFPHKAFPTQKSDLVVAICTECDDQELLSFTKWAHDASIPSLCVDFRSDVALIGPLTLSGRAGCGHCAFARTTAARATATVENNPISLDQISEKIALTLVREIQALLADNFESSSLLDHLLVVETETLDESLHRFIPLPHCSVCGGAAAFPGLAHKTVRLSPNDSPEEILGALDGWIDQRTGVISNLFIEPPDELQSNIPIIVTAAPPYIMENDGSLRRLPLGWGKGLTISGAVLSAVGEAIERYSASLPDPKRIEWKRINELDGEYLHPRAFGLYSEAQYQRADFPYVRFDDEISHPWVRGVWADRGEPVWVPAISVFLSIEVQKEQFICQGTSNGLAAGSDQEDASTRAIMELVERDAFMAAWLTGRAGQRVEIDDTLDPLLREVLKNTEAFGAGVEIYLLPASAIGTTVLCLALGDGKEYPGVTFGLGSDLDPHAALRQAILELGQTGPYLRRMMRQNLLSTPEDPRAVKEMLDHAAYYFPKERASAFDRLRSDQSSVQLRDLKSESENCVSALKDAGIRVALIDVTSADVATGPFRIVRAVSPDLQTIWYGYGLERQPIERIRRMKVVPDIPPINPIW